MPYRLTMAHYFAYYNNPEGLAKTLNSGPKYIRDFFKKTPL